VGDHRETGFLDAENQADDAALSAERVLQGAVVETLKNEVFSCVAEWFPLGAGFTASCYCVTRHTYHYRIIHTPTASL
jgi:hypothetical protein